MLVAQTLDAPVQLGLRKEGAARLAQLPLQKRERVILFLSVLLLHHSGSRRCPGRSLRLLALGCGQLHLVRSSSYSNLAHSLHRMILLHHSGSLGRGLRLLALGCGQLHRVRSSGCCNLGHGLHRLHGVLKTQLPAAARSILHRRAHL